MLSIPQLWCLFYKGSQHSTSLQSLSVMKFSVAAATFCIASSLKGSSAASQDPWTLQSIRLNCNIYKLRGSLLEVSYRKVVHVTFYGSSINIQHSAPCFNQFFIRWLNVCCHMTIPQVFPIKTGERFGQCDKVRHMHRSTGTGPCS